MSYNHKGEEIEACATPYERALLCLTWAEDCRNKWYQGKLDARNGVNHVPGQSYYAEPINREIAWKKSLVAQDLVGQEQMYSRWATMYFAQVTAESLVEMSMKAYEQAKD